MPKRLESNLGFVSSVFTDMKSNRHFISCLFICSVVVPISLLAQTVPVTSPISGSSEVCDDENSIYSVNTDPSIIINEVKFDGTSGQDQIELKNVKPRSLWQDHYESDILGVCNQVMNQVRQRKAIFKGNSN